MKTQIGYLDVADGSGISAAGIFFNSFTHGDSKMLKECWLVDDVFVIIAENDEQVIVNRSHVKAWTALLPIDWLKGEQHESPEKQEQLVKARAARDDKRARRGGSGDDADRANA